ncbi:hypothetical protein [Burkholderia ubonensis]|uniref:hypothetical protein n=1 Tax=Burkholderia ubonensis TaxID=101571 RepID=UPI000F5777E7|nr:hypothetical protein [Burkholderia ubonensis]
MLQPADSGISLSPKILHTTPLIKAIRGYKQCVGAAPTADRRSRRQQAGGKNRQFAKNHNIASIY